MKKSVLFFSLLIFFSCKKDQLIPVEPPGLIGQWKVVYEDVLVYSPSDTNFFESSIKPNNILTFKDARNFNWTNNDDTLNGTYTRIGDLINLIAFTDFYAEQYEIQTLDDRDLVMFGFSEGYGTIGGVIVDTSYIERTLIATRQ